MRTLEIIVKTGKGEIISTGIIGLPNGTRRVGVRLLDADYVRMKGEEIFCFDQVPPELNIDKNERSMNRFKSE